MWPIKLVVYAKLILLDKHLTISCTNLKHKAVSMWNALAYGDETESKIHLDASKFEVERTQNIDLPKKIHNSITDKV